MCCWIQLLVRRGVREREFHGAEARAARRFGGDAARHKATGVALEAHRRVCNGRDGRRRPEALGDSGAGWPASRDQVR